MSCTCNTTPCVHTTANQSLVESVGRKFIYVGPPTQVEQDENGTGGIVFYIPYSYNYTVSNTDVVVSGTEPAGLTTSISSNPEGVTSIKVETPEDTVFVGGPYSTVFTVFGIATTVTIYATLQ